MEVVSSKPRTGTSDGTVSGEVVRTVHLPQESRDPKIFSDDFSLVRPCVREGRNVVGTTVILLNRSKESLYFLPLIRTLLYFWTVGVGSVVLATLPSRLKRLEVLE